MRLFTKLLYPFKWFFVSTKHDVKYVNKFADVFGSIPAFKQQLILMIIWIAFVLIFPKVDPNMFLTMAILTIYSAITQPMLAVGNSRTNETTQKLLNNNIHMLESQVEILEGIANTLEKLQEMIEKLETLESETSVQIDEIDESIEELVKQHQKVSNSKKSATKKKKVDKQETKE